jgi:hypothetical protein
MGKLIRKGQQQGQQRVIVRGTNSGLTATFDRPTRNNFDLK